MSFAKRLNGWFFWSVSVIRTWIFFMLLSMYVSLQLSF